MAKKIYNIPLQKVQLFIKNNRNIKTKFLKDKEFLEYYFQLGKTHYLIELEKYIFSKHINKNITSALQTLEYFQSKAFIDEINSLLNLQEQHTIFYPLCYELYLKDKELFKFFLEKIFLHFHTNLNKKTAIHINYLEIAKELAKLKKVEIKNSFGEDENDSFFKIDVDEKEAINLRGKSIKTLRKKAYKELTYFLLDLKENTQEQNVYDTLHKLKMM